MEIKSISIQSFSTQLDSDQLATVQGGSSPETLFKSICFGCVLQQYSNAPDVLNVPAASAFEADE